MTDSASTHDQVTELASIAEELRTRLQGIPLPKAVREGLQNFALHYEQYAAHAATSDTDATLASADALGVYAQLTGQAVNKMEASNETKQFSQRLFEKGLQLRKHVASDPSNFRPLGDVPSFRPLPPPQLPAESLRRLDQLVEEQEKQDDRIKNRLADNDKRLSSFAEALGRLESESQTVVAAMKKEHERTLEELQGARNQIDAILGHASGRVLSSDFDTSAAAERSSANWLRRGSLVCMAVIVGMLGYTFWETSKADFEWQKSIFRVALAFLISAPAAYLARESDKHRTQQYHHLQTALDLKAIAPYLASLPEDEQHRIKSEVAKRLFGGRDFTHVTTESSPVNVQEILMELVRSIRPQKGSEDK